MRMIFTSLEDCPDSSIYSQASGAELTDFSNSHQKFVSYLETLTPYLQLRWVHELALYMYGYLIMQYTANTIFCSSHCYSNL